MTDFTTFTIETAPSESKNALKTIENTLGFIPKLIARMAASPSLTNAFTSLKETYEKNSLTPIERRIVLLITSVENKSNVCIAAHSMELRQNLKADNIIIEAARNNSKFPDNRMNSLAEFVRTIVRNKGLMTESTREKFFRAGFTQQNALDVVLGITLETLTSYTSHLVQAPVDEELSGEEPRAAA